MFRVFQKALGDIPIRRPLHKFDAFLCAENANYLDAVEAEAGKAAQDAVQYSWPSVVEKAGQSRDEPILAANVKAASTSTKKRAAVQQHTPSDASRLAWFCKSWEEKGHITAKVDPLNLHNGLMRMPEASKVKPEELEPQFFGFASSDMDKSFQMGFSKQSGGLLAQNVRLPLRTLHERLKRAYGGTIGYEFVHIRDPEVTQWLRDRIETPERFPEYDSFSAPEKRAILQHLAEGELFEIFLHTKFVGAKRFGLDGGESLIPGMMEMLARASGHGIDNIVLGMPHRGRLSVLVNICGKPMEALFKEFKGLTINEMSGEGSGDVKYHLGMSNRRTLAGGAQINLSLLANPSHLEAVNPVVEGKARAKQYYIGDAAHDRVMTVQLHGDAAFAGQGVCYETMRLSELSDFTTGGTIHIVVNNQIGFTTDPKKSRSSPYCTDIGHVFGMPIIHVNGDRPEDVTRAFRLAVDFRKRFHRSVILDLVCYRRFGHNETDEPAFTQPQMYKAIRAHESILSQYAKQLVSERVVTAAEVDAVKAAVTDKLRAALANVDNYAIKKSEWYDSYWKNFKKAAHVFAELYPTKISAESFTELAAAVGKTPGDIVLHRAAADALKQRNASLSTGSQISWDTAEVLAMGSLLTEGVHVRIAGQGISGESRYHQRHLAVTDQNTGKKFCALSAMAGGKFTAVEAPTCAYGVLGFELGFSMENPQSLVLWVAHNADCVGGAQIVFDQFLCSGETKWGRQCGLVMSVPIGMRPAEHAGGRMERFLQAVDEDVHPKAAGYDEGAHVRINMEVVAPTTAANYFHVLRRQVHRNFRKPLVVFAPLQAAASAKAEFIGSTFQPIIRKNAASAKTKRIVFCCGQIANALAAKKRADVHVVSIEQLAPFPDTHVKEIIAKHPKASVCWAQEEPENMGAWGFVAPRLEAALQSAKRTDAVAFVGRPAATPTFFATTQAFKAEQQRIMAAAMGPKA